MKKLFRKLNLGQDGFAGLGPLSKVTGRVGGFAGRHKKGLIAGGGAAGLGGILIVVALPLVGLFQLLQIKEAVSDFLDKRNDRSIVRRARYHYKPIFDKADGNLQGFKRSTGRPVSDAIQNYRTNKLQADMKNRGFDVELDSKGKILSITLPSGQRVTDFSTQVADQRSAIRKAVKEAYPDMNYFRRGARARALYGRYGIQLNFFQRGAAAAGDKSADWVKRVKQRIRQRASGIASRLSIRGDSDKPPDEETEADKQRRKVVDGFPDEVQNKAGDIEKALKDPGVPDMRFEPGKVSRDLAGAATRGAIGGVVLASVDAADAACRIKMLLSAISAGAKLLVGQSLAKYSLLFMTMGDTFKNNDRGQLTGGEIGGVMKLLAGKKGDSNWSQSAGWDFVTGKKTTRTVSDNMRIDGGFRGELSDLNNFAGRALPAPLCRFTGNIFVQIGAGIAGVITSFVGISTAGAVTAGNVASGVALQVARSLALAMAEQIAVPIAARMLAGATVTGDESPDQMMNAIVGGYNVTQANNMRGNGGRKLKKEEIAQIDRAIALEETEDRKNKSLAKKLFDYTDTRSLAGKAVAWAPTNFTQATDRLAAMTGVLDNFNWRPKLTLATNIGYSLTPATYAVEPTEDPWGVDQHGFTDAELDSNTDIVALEEEVIGKNKSEYDSYVAKCLTSDDPANYDPDTDNECTNPNELQKKFRLYHFDLGIMCGISSFNSDDDDFAVNPVCSALPGTSTSSGGGGPLPTGTESELASKILARENITYDPGARKPLEELAAGRQASVPAQGTTTNVSAVLLGLLLKMSEDGIPLRIGALTTGTHSPGSYHYIGKAVDIGNEEEASRIMPFVFNNRDQYQINEMIHAYPPAGTQNLDNGQPFKYDQATLNDHKGHIHISVK